MKRVIVDYKKLTPKILRLLVEKYPDGYGVRDIVKFVNAKGKYVDAVEIRLNDCIYLIKISDELADTMEDFELEDDEGGLGTGEMFLEDDDVV